MEILIFLPIYLVLALLPGSLTYYIFLKARQVEFPLLRGGIHFLALAIIAPVVADVKESGIVVPLFYQLISKHLLEILQSPLTSGYLFFISVITVFLPFLSYVSGILPKTVTRFLGGWKPASLSREERCVLATRRAARYLKKPITLSEASLQCGYSESELMKMIDSGKLKAYEYHSVLIVSEEELKVIN